MHHLQKCTAAGELKSQILMHFITSCRKSFSLSFPGGKHKNFGMDESQKCTMTSSGQRLGQILSNGMSFPG